MTTPAPPYGAIAVAFGGALLGTIFAAGTAQAIANIGGGLSVSAREAAWFLTVYDVGQVVGLPLVWILAAGLGRSRAMALAGLAFAAASIWVALAPDLATALPARFAHGIFGGMLPVFMMLMVMSSLRPGHGQAEGMALFALSVTLGAGVSAVVAADLIQSGGWRSLFWAQAGFGLVYAALASVTLRHERGRPEIVRMTDWPSYVLLSLSLTLLVIAISEGERHFWLESWWVSALLIAGGLGLGMTVLGLRRSHPALLHLSIFSKPTFTWSSVIALVFRVGTVLTVWVAPQYLIRLQGYTIEEVGQTFIVMVPATLLAVPCAYLLTRFLDARIPLTMGLLLLGFAAWACTGLSSDWAMDELQVSAAAAGAGQGLVMVPTLAFAVHGVQAVDGMTCGLLFNLSRILGQIGATAGFAHLVAEREKYHFARLTESVVASGPEVSERLADLGSSVAQWVSDPAAVAGAATTSLARQVSGQASTLGFGDAFWLLAVICVAGAALVWMLPRLPPAGSSALQRPHS